MVANNTNVSKHPHLIIFDVEGVLIPKRRYLFWEVAKRLNLWKFINMIAIGLLYEVGALPLETALRKIFALLRGLAVDDLFQLFKQIPFIPGVETLFERLNKAGYRTALISSGLPTSFVKYLATRLNANYAFGLELNVTDGRLTGEIGGDVIKRDGKALVLRKILESEGSSPRDCVVVADDRNNLPMFPLCAVKVGYNPDFLVSAKSDWVIRDSLSEIIPSITGSGPKVPSPILSTSDFIREIIHISGFLVPFFCNLYVLNHYLISLLIIIVTLLFTASEIARVKGINIPIFSTITFKAAIKPELYEFVTSPIFFALGIALSLILFPVPNNYAAVTIFSIGDGSATLIGKKLGKVTFPFNKGKRVEGSVLGFLLAFASALLFVNPVKALIGATIGMFVECLPLPISDNLTVPIATGLTLTMIP